MSLFCFLLLCALFLFFKIEQFLNYAVAKTVIHLNKVAPETSIPFHVKSSGNKTMRKYHVSSWSISSLEELCGNQYGGLGRYVSVEGSSDTIYNI